MFRSAFVAVLAVALSSSPVFAQQVTVAAAGATSLVISSEAVLSVTSPGSLVPFAVSVTPESASSARRDTPWWPTALAIAGPLADGLTTVYAMRQSGPNMRVVEGNAFYHKLFGANVKSSEIMAFKVAQAALMGYGVHLSAKRSLERAVASVILQSALNVWVSSQNVRLAARARRLNAGAR